MFWIHTWKIRLSLLLSSMLSQSWQYSTGWLSIMRQIIFTLNTKSILVTCWLTFFPGRNYQLINEYLSTQLIKYHSLFDLMFVLSLSQFLPLKSAHNPLDTLCSSCCYSLNIFIPVSIISINWSLKRFFIAIFSKAPNASQIKVWKIELDWTSFHLEMILKLCARKSVRVSFC